MRRLIVLAVVVAVVAGGVTVAKSLLGDDTSTAAGQTGTPGVATLDPDAGTPSTLGDSAATTATSPADSSADSTGETTTIAGPPDPGSVPTAADPARVLLVGDSEAGGLSPSLKAAVQETGVATMTVDYKSSTGLVRPDYFDWPTRLRSTVPAADPDIVVALFGGNDGQPFPGTNDHVDSAAWRTEYGKRVGDVMDFLSADGRTLIWVGVPNALDDDLTASLAVQNEVVKAEVAKRPQVIFVDSWHYFTGIDGGFASYAVDPRDGEYKNVRSETDGFHLNSAGEGLLAYYVGTAVLVELKNRGAAI